ncbi:pectate lyase [Candidatus Poribacteria bacterium]|nr:pectate lyase [Candidatus Poribacteria bacterium]
MTLGGRGGKVILVTNLNDSGPGSLREACETAGPRIVVFTVSGTITLESRLTISNPYITIAGQTAPGDGICIKKYQLSINASEVIIRYIRVRLGDETDNDADAISGRYHKNIILDHVSASWSIDETVSIYYCENVTIQWCLISESLYNAGHVKGTHGFGGIWGSDRSTYHHNLLAHHSSRNPRFASGCGYNDFRNNVIYNWGYNGAYGGEKQHQDSEKFNFTVVNMVANYFKPGPATRPGERAYRIINPSSGNLDDGFGKWYVADNVVHGNPTVTANNWDGGVQPQGGSSHIAGLKLDEPFDAIPINQQTAEEAYATVLESVGAALPKRDSIDTRIIDETRNGYATYEGVTYKNKRRVLDASKKCGMIDSQADVGGWPQLKSLPAPLDSDADGMPDEWEKRYGLDSQDASNTSQDTDNDGYTNIEEYLNGTDPTEYVDYTQPENNVNVLK